MYPNSIFIHQNSSSYIPLDKNGLCGTIIVLVGLFHGSSCMALTFPTLPLVVGGSSDLPNVLVVYDNSCSMEYPIMRDIDDTAFTTNEVSKSTVTRRAIRNIFNQYKANFNFGLAAFETINTNKGEDKNGRVGRVKIYQGSDTTMIFTNDCVGAVDTIGGGVSPSNKNLPCVRNPEPNNGYAYITYEYRSIDFMASYAKNYGWGRVNPNYGPPAYKAGSVLDAFQHHSATTSWNVSDSMSTTLVPYVDDFAVPFFNFGNPFLVGPFDSPSADPRSGWMKRLLLLKKGVGFDYSYTGKGRIIEQVKPSTDTIHSNNFLAYMAPESPSLTSTEIKDSSPETPSIGSMITAKSYFSGLLPQQSPIKQGCQKNYVLFATDGMPTLDANGTKYTSAEADDPFTGRAYTELYNAISSLHNTNFNGQSYDINTYILGIGDVGSSSVKASQAFTKMALAGGTKTPYYGTDEAKMNSALQEIFSKITMNLPIRQSNGRYAISSILHAQPIQVYKAFYAAEGNIWQGNLIKTTPTAEWAGGVLNYDTGSTSSFSNGAAQWLTSDLIAGKPRQIITAVRPSVAGPLTGVPFEWGSIGKYTQSLLLNPSESNTVGSQRLSYIRGDRSNEVALGGTTGFRRRGETVLGDIINSSPMYVGTPLSGYSDSDFPSSTTSFSSYAKDNMSRRGVIYVGANDGMLHAFDAKTLQEVFSYIPNSVLQKLKDFSNQTYTHDFFVDETPIIADVLISGSWMTQLIGFPGMGGKGLFALDISSPDNFRAAVNLSKAQANAKNIVLWELNGATDNDIGYIINHGQVNQLRGGMSQQVGKLANNRWAVITGNGYNSANDSTGLVISYLDAKSGVPSYKKMMVMGVKGGLSTPTTVDVNLDGVIDYAYAGDLHGNVWKFTLQGSEASWGVSKLFSSTVKRPITTAPAIAYHCSKNGLMVIVGTGKYLEQGDTNPAYDDNHIDALIGLWDKLDGTSILSSQLQPQSYYTSGDVSNPNAGVPALAKSLILTTDNAVDWSKQRGWYLYLYNDYPTPARILMPPYLRSGLVYFNTVTPQSTACGESELLSTMQALNFCTGARPQTIAFDINFDGKIDADDQYTLGGKKVNVTGLNLKAQKRIIDSSLWLRPKQFSCATPPCPSFKTGLGDAVSVNIQQAQPKRASWREVKFK